MKKIITIAFLFLTFNAFAQTDSTVFDIYNSYFAQTYSHGGCGYADTSNGGSVRRDIPAGSYPQTIFGHEWRGVTGNPGAGYYGKNPMFLNGIYYPDPTLGWIKTQASFTIKYPFKKGYKYDIVIKCAFDDLDPNYGMHPPALQLQLTNTPDYTYGRDCFTQPYNYPPVYDLTTSSNPSSQFLGDPGVNYNHDFVFTPNECYSYVWLLAKTNEIYENYGSIDMYKIVIYETPDLQIPEIQDAFCPGTTKIYSLNKGNNAYNGNNISWSTSGAISIQGSNSNTVTISNNGIIGATGTLTATIPSDCGNISLSKPIIIAGAQPSIQGSTSICAGLTDTNYWVEDIPSATNYAWSVSPSTAQILNNGTQRIYLSANTPGTYYLNLVVTTACGLLYSNYMIGATDCGGSGGGGLGDDPVGGFIAYPNPTANTITLSSSKSDSKSTVQKSMTNQSFTYKLYNKTGKILRQGLSLNGEDIKIETKDISNGTYFLHVIMNKQEMQKQIIIHH